jgi:hypothetical protein
MLMMRKKLKGEIIYLRNERTRMKIRMDLAAEDGD